MIGRTCGCGWIHPADSVRVVGSRFLTAVHMYRAYPDGPPRATRAEAMRDVCPQWTPTPDTSTDPNPADAGSEGER